MPADVKHNEAESRFELDVDGETAVAYYRLSPGTMTFTHTETPPHLRNRGIASRLAHGALEAARTRGLKVVPRCGFIRAYIDAHPEFRDLVQSD